MTDHDRYFEIAKAMNGASLQERKEFYAILTLEETIELNKALNYVSHILTGGG